MLRRSFVKLLGLSPLLGLKLPQIAPAKPPPPQLSRVAEHKYVYFPDGCSSLRFVAIDSTHAARPLTLSIGGMPPSLVGFTERSYEAGSYGFVRISGMCRQ